MGLPGLDRRAARKSVGVEQYACRRWKGWYTSARLGCETFEDHREEMVLPDVSMSSDGYFPAEKASSAFIIYEAYLSPAYQRDYFAIAGWI